MQLTRVLNASRKLPSAYHNIPKRYIERHVQFVDKRAPRLPQYEQKVFRYKRNGYYDEWRPWEREFEKLNQVTTRIPRIFVEPIKEFPFFRGDRVEVLRGPDQGKQGTINYIVKERNWVFVQGVNLHRSYINRQNSLGTIVTKEDPLLVNYEVKLVDPSDLLPCDIEWRYDDDGNRVRVSTRTERIIPIPELAYETMDYKEAKVYVEQPKDTPADMVAEKTFKPEARTFEMDICNQLGISDERVPYPMYWY